MTTAPAPHPLAGLFAGQAHAAARAVLAHVCIYPQTPLDDAHLRCLADPAEAAWLLKAARRTTTAGLLWTRLTPQQRAELPDKLRAGLHELCLGYGLQAECARTLLAVCAQRLAPAGIPLVALKGAALSMQLYGDPAERPMNDVDLLVPEGDLTTAYRLLTGNDAPATTGERHLPPLVVLKGLPPVEVHGHESHVATWPQEAADFFAVSGDIGTLSSLNNWLHIACHGTTHTFGIWPRMAADLARLQGSDDWQEGHWERVWELASRHGQRRRVLMAAALTNAGRLPERLRLAVGDERLASDAERRARRAWWAAWEQHGPGTVKWVKLWTLDPERLPRALARQAFPSPRLTASRLHVPVPLALPLIPLYGLYRLGMLAVSTAQGLRLIRVGRRVLTPPIAGVGTRPPTRPSLLRWLPVLPPVAALLLRLRRVHPTATPANLVAAATPPPRMCDWPLDRAQVATRLCRALVRRLPRLFPQPCLYYSLGGYYFLRRGGEQPVLHVGVREAEGGFVSHAWLTLRDEPVFDDPPEQGFVEMVAYR